jgi:hypothetical protein
MRYSLGDILYLITIHFQLCKTHCVSCRFKIYERQLIVKSESINDLGFTLGLGLPITGSFSNINFGFEMGKEELLLLANSRKLC